jgi:hypothetical protein
MNMAMPSAFQLFGEHPYFVLSYPLTLLYPATLKIARKGTHSDAADANKMDCMDVVENSFFLFQSAFYQWDGASPSPAIPTFLFLLKSVPVHLEWLMLAIF